MSEALAASGVCYVYPARGRRGVARAALSDVSFSVEEGEMLGLLGPNGGGKSTLLRVLSTAAFPASGRVRVLGEDIALPAAREAVRRRIGVVFQSPALDDQLTVNENLTAHGHLYAWSGPRLRRRIASLAGRFELQHRLHDRVGILSGGLKRRVELAKALLPQPELLLLDEASLGLDPVARKQWREELQRLRRADGLTILLTTHYLEEAEACDRVGLLDGGRLVALDRPDALKSACGADVIWVESPEPEALARGISEQFHLPARVLDGGVRLEENPGPEFVPQLLRAFPGPVTAVRIGKPTLEDVFVQRTGHRLEASA